MSEVKVEVDRDKRCIIDINGLPHLVIGHCVAFHSYIEEDTVNPADTRWFIEFHLASGQTIKAEYDNRELWETILKGL